MKQIHKRKNYLHSFILTCIFWLITGYLFFYIPPVSLFIIIIFLLTLSLALLFTFSLLLGSSKRGTIIILGLSSLLVLKKIDQFTLFNLLLIILILIAVSLFLKKSKR